MFLEIFCTGGYDMFNKKCPGCGQKFGIENT